MGRSEMRVCGGEEWDEGVWCGGVGGGCVVGKVG